MNPHLKQVLVVEDNDTQRLVLVELLRFLGVPQVFEAANGFEAIQVITQQHLRPDVVITDLEMPQMDGVTLVSHLGEGRLCQSVIVVSGYENNLLVAVRNLCEEAGMLVLGIIQKPYQTEDLQSLLNKFEPVKLSPPKPVRPADIELSMDEIFEGLHNKEFGLYYQPKIEVQTGVCRGVEALVRWFSPKFGMVTPNRFIPMLEAQNKMDDLTYQVVEKAVEQASFWHSRGYDITVSINLSTQNLNDENLVEKVHDLIQERSLPPRVIVFEVTESSVIDNDNRVQALGNLARLRLRGFGLSIDDYGIGYSNLAQLGRIPFTELKIDRSLVHGAHAHPERRLILQSAVEMAKKLKLRIVAEGVEKEQDCNLVMDLGCDYIQGYYFSVPLNPTELEDKFLNSQSSTES